jgi:phage terminase large subunit GpA-like protein
MASVTVRPDRLSKWIEANVCPPEGSATPGPFRLYPYQRGIADAIADPKVERVSVLKSARIGFSNVVAGAPPPSLTRFHHPPAEFRPALPVALTPR